MPDIIAPAIDEKKTSIVIIQNGVGNEEPFRKAFPGTTIITCVVSTINIALREPRYLIHTRRGWALYRHLLG